MIKESFYRTQKGDITLDYRSVLRNISDFRKSNGKDSNIRFDAPQTYFFKIFFFFDNDIGEATNSDIFQSNLLSLKYDKDNFSGMPWLAETNIKRPNSMPRLNHVPVNTAFNYLLLNNEWERAEKLIKFVNLLSEISCNYPWYFSSISGLENAITRKEVTETEFKIEEQRRNIQIKCMHDSEDNKIGKLLDLYRDITYSQILHKEIVPANLRKFDMGIFIFSRPIKSLHRNIKSKEFLTKPEDPSDWTKPQMSDKDYSGYASFKPQFDYKTGNEYNTSYKYIELHNCEIDYNSSASAYSDLNNADGFKQEYTINIFFDDALENRYDEHFMRNIGDFSIWDAKNLYNDKSEESFQKIWESFFQQMNINEKKQEKLLDERTKNLTSKAKAKPADKILESLGITPKDHIAFGGNRIVGEMWKSSIAPSGRGFLTTATNQLAYLAKSELKKNVLNPLKKFALGNFYVTQYKNTVSMLKDLASGNILGASKKFGNLIGKDTDLKNAISGGTKKLGNMVKGWVQKS